MNREYQKWLNSLPKFIKEKHIEYLKKLSRDTNIMEYFKSKSIDEIEGFNCRGILNLEEIYDMNVPGQGNGYGKGEILTSFLLQGCNMSGIKMYDLLWDEQELQVKALKTESEDINLGIAGTFTGFKLGRQLIALFDKIIDLGNADETLIEEFPFWFTTYYNDKSVEHNGKWNVHKYAKQEIGKKEFSKMITEIPRLSEHINHRYSNDITNFIEDIRLAKEEISEKLSNYVIWVNGRCHKVMNPIVHPSNVTRSAVKVSLKEVISLERRVTSANIANVSNEVRQEVFQELLNNGTISYQPLMELIESSRIGTRFCFTDDNGWRVAGRRGIESIQNVNIPIRERNDIDTILKVDKIFRLRRENDVVVGIDEDNPYGFSVSLVEVE